MWFILGMIVLAITCATIQTIVSEIVKKKKNVFFIGYCLGVIIVLIFVARFIRPKLQEYENKVNELTTKLYESYSLVDSLNQSLEEEQ